jgi:hypothetical protein
LLAGLSCLILVIAGLGGGGHGGLGDLLAQQLGLALLALLLWQGVHGRIAWHARPWVRWLPALALALPLLQLIPIPMSLWTAGPARMELAAQMAQAGVLPRQVISLYPDATEAALWSLIPAVALFLATLALSRSGQRVALMVIAVLAVASVFMGMAQVNGGTHSPLRLYEHTNADQAVGFFANRNHFAGLLVMVLPMALGWTAWAVIERLAGRRLSIFLVLSGCSLVILLILGIALSHSRAGLVLGMLAILGTLPIVMGLRRQRGTKRILGITLGIAVMLTVQFSLLGVLQRLEGPSVEDGRWRYTTTTFEAAAAYAPWGSGLGTFRQAYQPFEAKGTPTRYIVNHAHDDYVELCLEGGVPALLLLATGLFAWAWLGFRLWRTGFKPDDSDSLSRLLIRCAWWAASLGLLHSALDYPLRTTADMSVFAVLAAIAFSGSRAR